MRYADSKDVLEKSHNLASESEATVLPTFDSAFIKISCTPRSTVPPDKRNTRDLYCSPLWNHRYRNRYVTSQKSSTKSFHFYPITLPSAAEIRRLNMPTRREFARSRVWPSVPYLLAPGLLQREAAVSKKKNLSHAASCD